MTTFVDQLNSTITISQNGDPGFDVEWFTLDTNWPASLVSTAPTPNTHDIPNKMDFTSLLSSNGTIRPSQIQLSSTSSSNQTLEDSLDYQKEVLRTRTINTRRRASTRSSSSHSSDLQYSSPHHRPRGEGSSDSVRKERNRNAAFKCRVKRRATNKLLDDQYKIERERNSTLRGALGKLQDECLSLKAELLRHSHCNDTLIENYVSRMAMEISRGKYDNSTLPS